MVSSCMVLIRSVDLDRFMMRARQWARQALGLLSSRSRLTGHGTHT